MKYLAFVFMHLPVTLYLVSPFVSRAADTVRPTRMISVESAESQVDESMNQQELHWVVRHGSGVKTVGITSGTVVDVIEHPRAPDGNRGRLLTADAKICAYRSYDRKQLTVARVADGRTIIQADADLILRETSWPSHMYLANDGSHFYCLSETRRPRIVRVDVTPMPRVSGSQELKGKTGDVFDLFATGTEPELIVAAASGAGGGWFHVFDNELKLRYSQKLRQPVAVYSALNGEEPLILLTLPHFNSWQLVRGQEDKYNLLSSGTCRSSGGGEKIFAAAISPDGKFVVASQLRSPRISVWNTSTGALVKEFRLEGGVHRLPSDQNLSRLRFSKSGRFLAAADMRNAYLLDFRELIDYDNGNGSIDRATPQ